MTAVGIGILLTAGCGGGSNPSSNGSAASSASPQTTAEPETSLTNTAATLNPVATPPTDFKPTIVGNLMVNGVSYYQSSASTFKAGVSNPPYAIQNDVTGSAVRFEVHSGDYGYVADPTNGNERAELVTFDPFESQSRYLYQKQQEAWVSFSFMVEKGEPILPVENIVGQMHYAPSLIALPPPLSLNISPSPNDTVTYSLRTRSLETVTAGAKPSAIVRWSRNVMRGTYVNVVLCVAFDSSGDGRLSLWVDGSEQVKLDHVPVGYGEPVDRAYWQFGIYRKANANPLAVRYANLEQGPNSLLARVSSPLAIPAGAQ